MSSTEYWDGDALLPKYYRKAYRMKQDNANQQAWLHGLYIYDALMSALSHLNPNKNSHTNYTESPYSFDKEKNKENEIIEAQARAEVWMKSWASATQKMFKTK